MLTTAPQGENAVKLWDLQGHELLTFPTPDNTVHSSWSPDGSTIVTASDKGEARLWKTIPWNELAQLGDDGIDMDDRLRLWSEQR